MNIKAGCSTALCLALAACNLTPAANQADRKRVAAEAKAKAERLQANYHRQWAALAPSRCVFIALDGALVNLDRDALDSQGYANCIATFSAAPQTDDEFLATLTKLYPIGTVENDERVHCFASFGGDGETCSTMAGGNDSWVMIDYGTRNEIRQVMLAWHGQSFVDELRPRLGKPNLEVPASNITSYSWDDEFRGLHPVISLTTMQGSTTLTARFY